MNNRENEHIEGEHELFDGAVADLLALEGGVRKQGQILEGGDGERLELFPRKGGLHRLLLPLDLPVSLHGAREARIWFPKDCAKSRGLLDSGLSSKQR